MQTIKSWRVMTRSKGFTAYKKCFTVEIYDFGIKKFGRSWNWIEHPMLRPNETELQF